MSITNLILLFIICFFQNMIFTFTSRSRNSGNVPRHFIAALMSNSTWFIVNYFLLFPEIMKATKDGDFSEKCIIAIVYMISTALGSITMMKINLGHWYVPYFTESDKKDRVGGR